MTNDTVAILLLTLAGIAAIGGCIGLALLHRRHSLSAAGGVEIVASDTGAVAPMILRDPSLGLSGKPDYVLRETHGGGERLVALELKPARRSNRVYESDAVQVSTYAMLLRASYGDQAAAFGYLRYATGTFEIRLTPARERQVTGIVAAIRRARVAAIVNRSHDIPARCAGCAMRPHCNERL